MKKTEQQDCHCGCQDSVSQKNKHHRHHGSGQSNAIYSLGVIGALFYYISTATSFGMVLLGIAKSIFWPAILMFKLLTFLQM